MEQAYWLSPIRIGRSRRHGNPPPDLPVARRYFPHVLGYSLGDSTTLARLT
jgi:hypothetical protein